MTGFCLIPRMPDTKVVLHDSRRVFMHKHKLPIIGRNLRLIHVISCPSLWAVEWDPLWLFDGFYLVGDGACPPWVDYIILPLDVHCWALISGLSQATGTQVQLGFMNPPVTRDQAHPKWSLYQRWQEIYEGGRESIHNYCITCKYYIVDVCFEYIHIFMYINVFWVIYTWRYRPNIRWIRLGTCSIPNT